MKPDRAGKQLSTAERFAALSRVSTALMSELSETQLLQLIAETARELTGAEFAAFNLRPTDEAGQPSAPLEEELFHLAVVAGVTQEQEAFFRHMPLGGEGLLAPIFHHGVPVLIPDVLTHRTHAANVTPAEAQVAARKSARAFAHGQLTSRGLRSVGMPGGHPVVRSFLGVPLLDQEKQILGGLLLGHTRPGRFTSEDETLLTCLAAQAASVLGNARLYRDVQMHAQEFDAFFESMVDGIMLVDAKGRIQRENETARCIRKRLQAHPGAQGDVEALLRFPILFTVRDLAVRDQAVTVTDENGETREYLVTISPLYYPQAANGPLQPEPQEKQRTNAVSGAVIVWHDMTERRFRELEHAERAHASQLEAIFEAMKDGIVVYDREGRVTQINTGGRAMFARLSSTATFADSPKERFEHFTMFDELMRPLTFAQWPVARILAGEVVTPDNAPEILYESIDGQIMHLSVAGGPLRDAAGQPIGAVIIFRDVTERRRLERIEREAWAEAGTRLALLQMILDELPGSVYLVHGRDARLVLANKATRTIWGASWPDEVPLATFLEQQQVRIFGVDGRVLAPSELATLRAVRDGESLYQHQESIHYPDGTVLPVMVNAVALDTRHLQQLSQCTGETDPEPAAIVMHQDVTALKGTERLKDEFIALAAHELRTPLTILKGYAQTLLVQNARGRGSELAEWQVEALQGIDHATERLVDLTDDLLDMARLQAGRLEFHLEPTDLVSLCRRVIIRLQLTTQQHQLLLRTECPYLVVSADPQRIEQILGNLFNNAVKYSPQGGEIELALWLDEKTNMAMLSIKDHGIGIPAEQQSRIFGRFARADNVRAHGIRGTGLGLYLCCELIERQGGRIWFQSEEGKGSTFFFTLPLFSPATPSSP